LSSIHTCIQEPHSHVSHLTCSCLVIEVWSVCCHQKRGPN
jgi:hypothetical protein